MWLIGAGPGDPELITVAGARALSKADVVLYDALSHPALLDHAPHAVHIDVGKRAGERSPPQDHITQQLIELASSGQTVARLKGGDPFMFARGAEEALALSDAGIPFHVVPGISSPVATTPYAGISLTHRDLSSSVTFITGSDKAGKAWSEDSWRRLATATDTIVVLMGMRRIAAITKALIAGGRAADTPAAVIQWGARASQRVLQAPLDSLAERVAEAGLTNPAVIVVGEVVSLREHLRWYDRRPLFGKRVLIPRPKEQARETAAAVRHRSAAAVVFPLIRIVDPPDSGPLRSAVANLSAYDWVVFTSANGVRKFSTELERQKLDARALGGCRVAAIGPKTAAALLPLGIRADLIAKEYVGETLAADLLDAHAGSSPKVLIPRALVARSELPDLLARSGAAVEVVPAYETLALDAQLKGELAELMRGVDVAMFTSSSTATSMIEALGADAQKLLRSVTVASIGPVTSATLRSLGVEPDVEAEQYTIEGLLDALEAATQNALR